MTDRDDAPVIAGTWASREVKIGGEPLDLAESLAVRNHAPSGFVWGDYGWGGPSQLALAILLRFTNEATAVRHYQAFTNDWIATLPEADFQLPGEVVREWLAERHPRKLFTSRGWVMEDEWCQLEESGLAAREETFDPPAVVTLKARGAVYTVRYYHDLLRVRIKGCGAVPAEDRGQPVLWRWTLAAWDAECFCFYGLGIGEPGIGGVPIHGEPGIGECPITRTLLTLEDVAKVGDRVGFDRVQEESGLPISRYIRVAFGAKREQ